MVSLNGFKVARMNKGMRQIDLANALGVSESSVAKWETGRAKPGPELSKKIEAVLGVKVDKLTSNIIFIAQ